MKIYFNSIGIITNVSNIGDSLRQGSVGNVLEAHFEGVDNAYHSAKFNFTRSDGSKVNNVVMEWDNNNAEVFRFVFNDSWFFALAGTTTLTIYLYDTNGNVTTQGQHQFSIESTDYDEEPTITINQYNEIMTAIAGKVATGNIIDNLESDASDKPLSARMGKALKQDVDTSVASAKSEIYAKVEEETTRIETELDTKFETERAELRAQVDEIKEENEYLRGEVNDLRNGLYGSVLGLEDEAYENVGVAVMDRANDYQIINNQRAQVKTIKGKTLVVNQLQKISTNATYTDSETGLTVTNNGDGSIRISGTILATKSSSIYITQPADMTTLTGQTYITMLGNRSPYLTFRIAGQNNSQMAEGVDNKIWVGTADRINASNIYMGVIGGVGQTIDITIKPKTINLTKAFGASNEPTTIEEFNRLTMGFDFDTYNEGTLTSTEISKFMVNPFNAFDGELESGYMDTNTGTNLESADNIRSRNFISVVCGETYTLYSDTLIEEQRTVYYYDKYMNYIGYKTLGKNITLSVPNNCCYIRFRFKVSTLNHNICFHLTGNGAFNGTYRHHIAPTEYPIPTVKLNGVGTAQDEITEIQYKKVIGTVDLGTLDWSYTNGTFRPINLANAKQPVGYETIPNALCSKYKCVSNKEFDTGLDKCFSITDTTSSYIIRFRDTSITDITTFKQAMSGVMFNYELKNPITLKKKYTGKYTFTGNEVFVDGLGGGKSLSMQLSGAKKPSSNNDIANILWNLGTTNVNSVNDKTEYSIALSTSGMLYITTTKTSSELAQAIKGKTIYFETTEEVTETVNELFLPEIILEGVERGGTVATDSNGDVTLTHVVYKPIQ